jgi:hypothetical protein
MTNASGRHALQLTTSALALAVALAPGAGCSFSHSSKSSSDSVSGSSESVSGSSRSSSGSSSPESEQARYEQDVADYTEAYVISGGSDGGFLRGVGDIAEKRGISDWESHERTWEGIGRGLARVHVSEVQLDVYKANWSGGDPTKVKAIEKGYGSGR